VQPSWWDDLAPFVRVERYGHRKDGQSRIEVTKDGMTRSWDWRGLIGECAHCGRDFLVARERNGSARSAYVRVSCGATACVRSEKTRIAFNELVRYLLTGEGPVHAGAPRLEGFS
jgi:hypothetical protein